MRHPRTRRHLAAPALLAAVALACAPTSEAIDAAGAPVAGQIVVRDGAVEIPARVHTDAFEHDMLGMGMPGYHLIVWDDGRAGHHALFTTPVSDSALLEALEALGATPGDALGLDTWEERKNPDHPAPDRLIEGPPVEVLVRVPGRAAPLTLAQILEDPANRGFDMRFGGHRANIPEWKSGCIACLVSCPGSKVGNRSYTVRDYVSGVARFRVKPGVLPEDGTAVTVVLRPRP